MTPGFLNRSHRSRLLFVAFLQTVCVGALSAAEPPVVPGLDHKHPLNDGQVGNVLLNELRCASCHEGVSGTDMKAAPDLRRVGERLKFDYLQKFIADPAAMHPGSTMPSLLASESEESRKAISESIAHYLLSLQAPASPKEKAPKADANAGRALFHGIGCIACHSPRDESGKELSTAGDLSLSHVSAKFQAGALAEFLLDPLKVRPSGRMPDMNLSREEAASLASYLMGEPPAAESQKTDAGKAAAG
ncbi:MAG: hypothetical protein CFE26_07395, partial [Verrucomicrobiales bacterium VVV1]